MSSKNLLWLTQGDDTLPSVRFRVIPIAKEISKYNINVTTVRYPKTFGNRFIFLSKKIISNSKYDVCIIQKRLLKFFEISILRSIAKKIVFDFDDAIWTDQKEAAFPPAGKKWTQFQNTTAKVDLVIAGNRYLFDALQNNTPKIISPTPIDTSYYLPKKLKKETDIPVIGWMGTSSYIPGTESAIRNIRTITKNKIRIISNAPPQENLLNETEFIKWSPENELSQLQEISIGIMPLPEDGYTKGKCGFKLLQYMSCKAVPIASSIGFNKEVITHGVDGFLVKKEHEWSEYANLLIKDCELREKMANCARRKIEEKFDVKKTTVFLMSNIFNET
jgi:glycosyltransferase involved in cell wall biosynthesis